ncbi:MAG: NAD(P)H-quinone oxidoreductase subunit L [Oscillatoriales cyanobacterium SM2_2_1]|nr:NAD(P)H-quinone oxidoreductase subunit L [Oscillatoriales cyanobacterium SM2_2_1]
MELSLLLPIALYGAILVAYFLVVPLILMVYFKARWYKTGAWERAFLCFMVFFFFPGLLVVSPFLNFRPPTRSLG